MLNFTVGPVMESENVKRIGGDEVPYFRTDEFSAVMKENEKYILKYAHAPSASRAVFLTGSGTASMEASIINLLNQSDNVLIVNGGSFGQRFVELCEIHEIPHTQIKLESGKTLTKQDLEIYDGKDFTAFIVNAHETSTGVLYDLDMIHRFCERNHLFLIVDAISSFIADEIKMDEQGIDALIIGSQKALACPPGISIIVLSEQAQKRIDINDVKCMYLNLKLALKDGERGQTPFTPAVGVLLQIHQRLKDMEEEGGIERERDKIRQIAEDFRKRIEDYPFSLYSDAMSNAVTALKVQDENADSIFKILKDEYGIWICPNGGQLKQQVFRVGHIGALTISDNDKLMDALSDMRNRGLL